VTDYQVVCTRKSARHAQGHEHITAIGIGSGNRYRELLSVANAYRWLAAGNRFFTRSPTTGAIAWVRTLHCCGVDTLTTSPDHMSDNNLDYLGNCL
jgi:hypothetical protein